MPGKRADRWERLEKRIDELAAEKKAREEQREKEQLAAVVSAAEAGAIRDGTIAPVLDKAVGFFQAKGLPAKVIKGGPADGPTASLEVTLADGSWVLIFKADPTSTKVEVSRSIQPMTKTNPPINFATTVGPYDFSEVTPEIVRSAVEDFAEGIGFEQDQKPVRPRAQVRGALRRQ